MTNGSQLAQTCSLPLSFLPPPHFGSFRPPILLLFLHIIMHILVTGANRGIGLGLVRELLKHDEVKHVFATHRHWADTKVRIGKGRGLIMEERL